VMAIGSIVSFGKPEPQLDRRSNLHLLFQQGRASCAYVVISPDGDILLRQIYDIIGSRPKLHLNEAGEIVVRGGQRRFTENDLPPSRPPDDASIPSAEPSSEASASRP